MISYHINEIKFRFLYISISIAISLFIVWHFKNHIIFYLTPINLIFTSLTEAFYLYLYFTIITSILLNLPLIYLNFYSFILPALFKSQVNYFFNIWFYFWWFLLLYSHKIIHLFIQFFIQFQSDYLNLALTFQHFTQFLNQIIVLYLILLIIPFTIHYFLQILIKNRKIYYFISLIIIALLTPPDLVSLILLTIPVIILTEIIIFINLIQL